MTVLVVVKPVCARCGQSVSRGIRSRHTGRIFCPDLRACDRRVVAKSRGRDLQRILYGTP